MRSCLQLPRNHIRARRLPVPRLDFPPRTRRSLYPVTLPTWTRGDMEHRLRHCQPSSRRVLGRAVSYPNTPPSSLSGPLKPEYSSNRRLNLQKQNPRSIPGWSTGRFSHFILGPPILPRRSKRHMGTIRWRLQSMPRPASGQGEDSVEHCGI
jgi:hypothetical protein